MKNITFFIEETNVQYNLDWDLPFIPQKGTIIRESHYIEDVASPTPRPIRWEVTGVMVDICHATYAETTKTITVVIKKLL